MYVSARENISILLGYIGPWPYDRFHVMEHMTMAVDRSRRHEWNMLRESGRMREATNLKGQRFLLLRNHDNLYMA